MKDIGSLSEVLNENDRLFTSELLISVVYNNVQ